MIRWAAYFVSVALFMCCDNQATPDRPTHLASSLKREAPLDIDSLFIISSKGLDTLDFRQIRELQKGVVPEVTNFRSLSRVLNDFCAVDSLKQAGKYHVFADSLQTGSSADAFAQSLGSIILENGSAIELWKMAFWSYNSSSVFSGTFVIGSIRFGEQLTHIPLGEIFSSIDLPSAVTELITSRISHDVISITVLTAVDEDISEPGEIIQRNCFNVRIDQARDHAQADAEFTAERDL